MGKVKKYVPKSFVYSAREVTDEKEAISQYGSMPVCSDEMILTDLYGNEQPESKEHLQERYIEVEIEEDKLKVDKDEMAYQYANFYLNNTEDELYISFQEEVRERNNK